MATYLPIDSSRRHETHDASPRGVALSILGLVAILIVILFSMRALFFHFVRVQQPQSVAPFTNVRALPQEPRLQVDPQEDWKEYMQRQDDALNSYGWVDRQRGVVRIPIDRAMDLLSERGLPTRAQSSGRAR
jgi:hypothetical protein